MHNNMWTTSLRVKYQLSSCKFKILITFELNNTLTKTLYQKIHLMHLFYQANQIMRTYLLSGERVNFSTSISKLIYNKYTVGKNWALMFVT